MSNKPENTFFTKNIYNNDIGLDINEDVLERIYADNIKPTDKLPIEFAFVTDKETKAIIFKGHLSNNFPNYKDLRIRDYEENYEITGTTEPMLMDLETINKWNKMMWDIGYMFDCKLDGWQVGT